MLRRNLKPQGHMISWEDGCKRGHSTKPAWSTLVSQDWQEGELANDWVRASREAELVKRVYQSEEHRRLHRGISELCSFVRQASRGWELALGLAMWKSLATVAQTTAAELWWQESNWRLLRGKDRAGDAVQGPGCHPSTIHIKKKKRKKRRVERTPALGRWR